jgi:hypothetical protein
MRYKKSRLMTFDHVEVTAGPLDRIADSSSITDANEETVSVATRVSNPDCSPVGINGQGDPTQTPPAFAEIVSGNFPIPPYAGPVGLSVLVLLLMLVRLPAV